MVKPSWEPFWGKEEAMPARNPQLLREVLACLMCSRMYFELGLAERLALVKSLAADLATGKPPLAQE
jgi:hypothetical protein